MAQTMIDQFISSGEDKFPPERIGMLCTDTMDRVRTFVLSSLSDSCNRDEDPDYIPRLAVTNECRFNAATGKL
jgi:hypothetical protein